MKICVVQAWGFEQLDGSNLRVYFLIKELVERGHKITVINSSSAQAEYSRKIFGCQAVGAGVTISRWDPLWKKFYKYILFIFKAAVRLKKTDFDECFGISLINALVVTAVRADRAAVLYVDFMSNYYRYRNPDGFFNYIIYRSIKFAEQITIARAHRLLVITKVMKKMINEKHREKTSVIPDGADTQKLVPFSEGERGALKKKHNLSGNVVIGYQGGIERWDGLQFLAEISPLIKKNIPEVKFFIAGRGSYMVEIKKIIQKNGMSGDFIFLGWVPSDKIPEIMAVCDLNVVPIPDHPSTAPLITFRLLESMAAGINVIVNDLPGVREVADESMIFLTDVENPAVFSGDVCKALSAPCGTRTAMRTKARAKIETMDWRRVAKYDADFAEGKNVKWLE